MQCGWNNPSRTTHASAPCCFTPTLHCHTVVQGLPTNDEQQQQEQAAGNAAGAPAAPGAAAAAAGAASSSGAGSAEATWKPALQEVAGGPEEYQKLAYEPGGYSGQELKYTDLKAVQQQLIRTRVIWKQLQAADKVTADGGALLQQLRGLVQQLEGVEYGRLPNSSKRLEKGQCKNLAGGLMFIMQTCCGLPTQQL